MEEKISVIRGYNKSDSKEKIIDILMSAFDKKLLYVIENEEKLKALLKQYINFENAFYCYHDNQIAGVLGFETKDKKFDNIKLRNLISDIGILKTIKTIFVYAPFSLKLNDNEIKIVAIAVDKNKRGLGIGTKILNDFYDYSKKENYKKVFLEVIDTNPKAKKLYEEHNFKDSKFIKANFINKNAGFSGVHVMEKIL